MDREEQMRGLLCELQAEHTRLVAGLVQWRYSTLHGLQEQADRVLHELRWLRSGDPACDIEPADNRGCRILDLADCERLRAELPQSARACMPREKDGRPAWSSLFWHSDNVRAMYVCAQEPVPQWFALKYGHQVAQR